MKASIVDILKHIVSDELVADIIDLSKADYKNQRALLNSIFRRGEYKRGELILRLTSIDSLYSTNASYSYFSIEEMAEKISADYAGKTVHLIGILKGSVFFMCELAKRITIPVTLDFISVSSYGKGTQSSGVVKFNKDLDETIEGRDVIIVEDILDSGRTLSYVVDIMKRRNPASLEVITLLDKPDRRVVPVTLAMTGFEIPDKFVVGYGLDYAQKYRNLPYIGVVDQLGDE